MNTWIEIARGPLLRFAVAVALLGLLRLVVLSVWSVVRPGGGRLRDRLVGLAPFRERPVLAAVRLLFTAATLVVPLFALGHLTILEQEVGLSYSPLPGNVLHGLLLAAVLLAAVLFVGSVVRPAPGPSGRVPDTYWAPFVGLTMISGFLAAHPWYSPLSYHATLLAHLLAGELALILAPFTSLARLVLGPFAPWDEGGEGAACADPDDPLSEAP